MNKMNPAAFLLLCSVAGSLVQGRPYEDCPKKQQKSFNDIYLEKNAFIPRTCLDYLQHSELNNGFYWLYDNHDQRYMVYCDLSSEPNAAWTLMMSWNQASNDLSNFRGKTFLADAPINHNTPSWNAHRQTLARMKRVRSHSTYWRATCSFNRPDFQNLRKSIDYRDYIRGKFSDLDVMTFVGNGICKPVEYANIRGHAAGSGTTAQFWQVKNTYLLHINSPSTDCGFKPNDGAAPSEDNFGYYGSVNRRFRCSAGSDATTQWWFGGYLSK